MVASLVKRGESDSVQPQSVFVSAGEASGDMYAAALVSALRAEWPQTEWFGCAGPRMQATGVRAVADARSLAVVGLVEVISHLPRIYGQYRKLAAAVERERPQAAILADSPDFHLPLARRVHRAGVPVIYLVAPQAWAWRQGRVEKMRGTVARLLCLFPFEEPFYRARGIEARYIGHPLGHMVRPSMTKDDFFCQYRLPAGRPMVALCPGSRQGEIARHLPILKQAVRRISDEVPATFVLAAPSGFSERAGASFFQERISGSAIQVIEGKTWDVVAHADLALAASGTVTMEAALLGTPMVTYYKVAALSWLLGRWMVKAPFLTMVNLVAGRRLVPELMQNEMTGERLARETVALLKDSSAREKMRRDLQQEVALKLAVGEDPMERAARIVREFFDEHSRKVDGNCA
ncbi:MAG: lipid-A-disaccharide synthase [Acidobacteria bacterium]|nr:lipid-A-disaccharide synthase [Acidobacteriota bacterium]